MLGDITIRDPNLAKNLAGVMSLLSKAGYEDKQ
jgi:hypothetical protein